MFILKFILISVVVLYVLAKASKYLMRWAFMLAGKKLQKEIEKQQAYQQDQATTDASYEVVNDIKIYVPPKEQKRPKNYPGGEYVDFEELK